MSHVKGAMKIKTESEIYHSDHTVSLVSLFSAAQNPFSVPALLHIEILSYFF